jgi:hypothetical protein
MNFTLTRLAFIAEGIFGSLVSEDGSLEFATLEHAYKDENGNWKPKLYDGSFTCVRGPHRLEGMAHDFITFEITGIEGHSNVLLHPGNKNADSAGCVLVGEKRVGNLIPNSRAAFSAFMAAQDGVDEFTLTVKAA